MPRNVYYYSVIKFVPNPVRGEAVNLGVVLVGVEGHYANYRMLARIKSRVRLLAPRFDIRLIGAFEEDLQALIGITGAQRRLDGPEKGLTVNDLRRATETRANQIQFTDPRVYLTADPESALDDLFGEFVRPRRYARGPKGIVDRQQLKITIAQSFARWNLEPLSYPERVEVEGSTGSHMFDYGLRNGRFTAAIYAISFQMAIRDDIVLHRDHVAWAAHDIHRREEQFPIIAVTSHPSAQTQSLYQESLKMLGSENVLVVSYDHFDDIRDRLVRTLFSEPTP